MNDFPDLVPPPERELTSEQRLRLRAALPTGDVRERHGVLTSVAAAAAVLAVVGGGLVLSRSLNGNAGTADPTGPGQQGNILQFNNGMKKDDGTMCVGAPPRTVVLLDQVTPLRDVVVSSVDLIDPQGATIGGSWYTPAAPGSVAVGGAFEEGVPGAGHKLLHLWHLRQPLAGARLEAAQRYTFFARVTLPPGGQLEGLRFAYRDGSTPTTSNFYEKVVARARC